MFDCSGTHGTPFENVRFLFFYHQSFYIFDIAITQFFGSQSAEQVVICFQFWVSLTSLSLRCEYPSETQRVITGDRKKKSRLKAGISL